MLFTIRMRNNDSTAHFINRGALNCFFREVKRLTSSTRKAKGKIRRSKSEPNSQNEGRIEKENKRKDKKVKRALLNIVTKAVARGRKRMMIRQRLTRIKKRKTHFRFRTS